MTALTVGSLFSGYGGLDLAVQDVFGADCRWHVENNPDAARILAHRWPVVPNLGDISAVDWEQVEPVDIICGGFPCQDISSAGRGAGIKEGTRSGLWHRFADAVRVLRPRYIVVENVSALLVRGFDVVAGDLAALGYRFGWVSVRASDVGACHRRERVFVVAVSPDSHGGRFEVGPQLDGQSVEGATDRDPCGRHPDRCRDQADGVALLPTPKFTDTTGAHEVATNGRTLHDHGPDLKDIRNLLPTPTTEPSTGNGHARNLGTEARLLPTPRTSDMKGVGEHGTGGLDLRTAVDLLPTPTAMDSVGSRGHRRDGTPYTATSGVTLTDATTDPNRWGQYAAAVARWEHATGRPAPDPTDDRGRLSPPFPEWMMGLPAGWVTDPAIGLSRSAQLRAIGNGVVSQQAAAAIAHLLRIDGLGAVS